MNSFKLMAVAYMLFIPNLLFPHGYAGKKFFPTTFEADDPFVSDEFSTLFVHNKKGSDPMITYSQIDYEFSKRLIRNLGISVGGSFKHLGFDTGSANGFDNTDLGIKYQFLTAEEHETILSVGTSVEIGNTGSERIGAETSSTITPSLFFGKGMGDIPESVNFLRPFAITAVISPNIPTVVGKESSLTWAFSLQYSFIYLQSFVKDVGLMDPFKRMILVVEFPFSTCVTYTCKGMTTGTVNPGLVWAGKTMELGLAAQVPVNSGSGKGTGILALFHFFIDDVFPKSIGRPLFL